MFGETCPECGQGNVVRRVYGSEESYACSAECGWWAPYEDDQDAT